MSPLREKMNEVSRSLLPIMAIVLVLSLTFVDVETDLILRFFICSVIVMLGLGIFLWGVDLAMNPIGENMSFEVATSKSLYKPVMLSFLLGFLITVAEPDLLILATQTEAASGGSISSPLLVYLISAGVGILVALGVIRLLRNTSLSFFMAITYAIILILGFFVSEEFLAISFDASGATTGALTTPFVLALSAGLSRIKGGKNAEEDAFGLVGIMSAGPILAVMIMSVVTGQRNIHGEAAEVIAGSGIIKPILNILPEVFFESLIALLPVTLLFFFYNFTKFKLKRAELGGIIKGLIYTLTGLTLFLSGVNSGFMDMGRVIGIDIADHYTWMLPLIGFVMGLIVVLAEPAVHVLGQQIEEVTAGHIPLKLIRLTLSLGVGIAIACSTIRIMVPQVKLWYFLLPGFALSILLSFKSDPVFVGIAYDAGGVASGPMTATFVLAFAQGAAELIPTADILVDGFGVIAMVAMTPVLSIMILGTVFKRKRIQVPRSEVAGTAVPRAATGRILQHDCIMAVMDRGLADYAVSIARSAGATGATIMHGRGSGKHERMLLNIELQPEKEIILLITDARVSSGIADSLLNDPYLNKDNNVVIFVLPTEATALSS